MRERRRRPRTSGSTVIEVPLAMLRESLDLRLRNLPYHGIEELAADIEEHGQTTPIFVRRYLYKEDDYEIIAGNRRFKALQHLNATTALVRVFDVDDDEAYDLALSENQHRGALSEIERAQACLRLAEKGKTQEEIAKRMGWTSDRVVRRYLQLAREATPPLIEKLQEHAISLRAALVFLSRAQHLSEERQRRILDEVANDEVSSTELEKRLREECAKDVQPDGETAPASTRPPLLADEPLRKLKDGGFIVRTLRLDVRHPSGVRRGVHVLRQALRSARRLEKRLEAAPSGDSGPSVEGESE